MITEHALYFTTGTIVLSTIFVKYQNSKDRKNAARIGKTMSSLSDDKKNRRPYTTFDHPHKSLLDKILGLLFPLVVPFAQIANCTCALEDEGRVTTSEGDDVEGEKRNKKMMESVQKLRNKITFGDKSSHNERLLSLNKMIRNDTESKDYLVGGTVLIPRNHEILSEWNITNDRENDLGTRKPEQGGEMIEVEVTCANSMISSNLEIIKDEAEYQTFKTCSLDDLKFSSEAEIIIHFHGGGMALGGPREVFSAEYLYSLMSIQYEDAKKRETMKKSFPKQHEQEMEKRTSSQNPRKLVLLAVNYRLAPEHPFPSQIIDSLSVISSLLNHLPETKLHLIGISAGASLALITYFESLRHYGKKSNIISVAVNDPMLLPRTDTESNYMNSISPFLPVESLRWLWGAYLKFDCRKYRKAYNEEIDFNSFESYSTALSECKWMRDECISKNMRRLITPQIDLPTELCEENSPTLIITTSTADPLQDDGIDLLEKIKVMNGGHLPSTVRHFDVKGSHAISLFFDQKVRKEFLRSWHCAIF